ncbi:MAG: hypothetical protein AAB429_02065, partial [Patescibacteria group bacterium]
RLTPFAIGIIIAAVMIFTSFNPLSAPWTLPLLLVVVAVLCARLADFRWRDKDFWGLLITPAMLVVSAVLIFILADDGSVRLAIALTTALLMYFYEEHLFRFIHLPAAYQAYGLQNVSGVISIITVFYLMASAYATESFIRPPLFILALVLFVALFLVTSAALWMSKVPRERALIYAFGGAVIFTELFIAASYLPTPFMTNGAFLAVLYYLYLGLSRAHVLAKLSQVVVRRYVGIGVVMLSALLLTAKWI